MRASLLAILQDRALRRGEFTLASGRKSTYYLDARLVTLHPEGAYLTARLILDKIREQDLHVEAVGGLTLGADPIAGAVAAVSHAQGADIRGFLVRKQAKGHGMAQQVEGGLPVGSRVVVVDDVITTAGSTLQAIRAVEAAGCKVEAVMCLVDRLEGGAEALSGYRFYPLFEVTELLETPAPGA